MLERSQLQQLLEYMPFADWQLITTFHSAALGELPGFGTHGGLLTCTCAVAARSVQRCSPLLVNEPLNSAAAEQQGVEVLLFAPATLALPAASQTAQGMVLTWSCKWLAGWTCLSSCFTASAAAFRRATA